MSSEESPDQGKAAPDELDDLEIETIGSWQPDLEERLDPQHGSGMVALPAGRPRGTPRVFIHADVMDEIVGHAREDTKREIGGVLLGWFYNCQGELVTDVRQHMRALGTRAGQAHVTFSHDTWAHINAVKDQSFPELRIVGWYHSHTNFGVFLSTQDIFTQESFFDNPGHVALVLDPLRRHVGAFVWREGRVVPAGGFWVSAEKPRASRAHWFRDLLQYHDRPLKPPGRLQRALRKFCRHA